MAPCLDRRGDYYSKVGEINLALEQANLALEEALNRKQQLETQLKDQEETVTAPSQVVTPTTSALDGRIAALQNQLDNLRLRYTDQHPEIVRIKQLIARIQEQKEQEQKPAQGQSQAALKAQNPIYQQLTIAIAEADAKTWHPSRRGGHNCRKSARPCCKRWTEFPR